MLRYPWRAARIVSQFECLPVFGNGDRPSRMFFRDVFLHADDGTRFTVNEEGFSRGRFERSEPSKDFVVIAMRGKPFDGPDLRPHRVVHAVNADRLRTFYKVAAPRTRGLKSDKDNGIAAVRQTIHQMMHNAAAGRHSV